MGHNARLRAERRAATALARQAEPLRILRDIWFDVRALTLGEPPMRAWQLLLEMLAHAGGWDTESAESAHVQPHLPRPGRFQEFYEAWDLEVADALELGQAFSDPIGDLYVEAGGPALVPMHEVRRINRASLPPPEKLRHYAELQKGLDSDCRTGRFMLDALANAPQLMMHCVNQDLWELRAAMVSARYLARYTSLATSFAPPGESWDDPRHRLTILSGRAVCMHADPAVVDLDDHRNWFLGGELGQRTPLLTGWVWTPFPWQQTLFIDPHRFGGFVGTLEQYRAAGGAARGTHQHRRTYEFSMLDPRFL